LALAMSSVSATIASGSMLTMKGGATLPSWIGGAN
jgi:hypothetical protein